MLRPPSRNHVVFLGGPELEYEEFAPAARARPMGGGGAGGSGPSRTVRAADPARRLHGPDRRRRGRVSSHGPATARLSTPATSPRASASTRAGFRRSSACPPASCVDLRVPIDGRAAALPVAAERSPPTPEPPRPAGRAAACGARDVSDAGPRHAATASGSCAGGCSRPPATGPSGSTRIARMQRMLRDGPGRELGPHGGRARLLRRGPHGERRARARRRHPARAAGMTVFSKRAGGRVLRLT